MAVATSYTITLQLVKMNGAYTESNSISPDTMQIYICQRLNPKSQLMVPA